MSGARRPRTCSIAETSAGGSRAGELSAVELAEAYLARIDAVAEPLNVFRTVTARAGARAGGRGRRGGRARRCRSGRWPACPVALKDNIEVAGVRMTARHVGTCATTSPTRTRRSTSGCATPARCCWASCTCRSGRSAARTQNIHFGDCHNPWDPRRVSGGSSGGSGAAIAADLRRPRWAPTPGGRSVAGVAERLLRPAGDRGARQQPRVDPGGVDVRRDRAAGAPRGGRRGGACTSSRATTPTIPASADVAGRRLAGGPGAGRRGPARSGCSAATGRTSWTPTFRAHLRAAAAQLERLGAVVEEVELPGHRRGDRVDRRAAAGRGRLGSPRAAGATPEVFAPTC